MACTRCTADLLRSRVGSLYQTLVSQSLSTTTAVYGKRRKEPVLKKWGLERYPNQFDSRKLRCFLDLPDFTYLDGRPTPLTKQQLESKQKNYELAKRIVMLSQEMEAAKSAHAQRIQDESARRANIINSKLKQKSQDL